MVQNKVVNVKQKGGWLVGMFNDPRKQLESVITAHNNEGWAFKFMAEEKPSFLMLLGTLVCTFILFAYVPVPGHTVIFEKSE